MLQTTHPITTQKNVLLAEDSTITQDLLSLALGKRGHQIERAMNAHDAVELLMQEEFDIALIDFHLPDRNGFELVREFYQLSEKDKVPRIVALTGDVDEVLKHDQSANHFDLILAKPFLISDLIDVVEAPQSSPRPRSAAASLMARQAEQPEPLISSPHEFHLIHFPFDFYCSFKNAVSMSIARHGAVDAIVFDAVPSEKEANMLTKIKGLGTAAHIDRTGKLTTQCDLSTESATEENLITFFQTRRSQRKTIHQSRLLSKTLEQNLLISLLLKESELKAQINLTNAYGVSYNHILPGEIITQAATKLALDDLVELEFQSPIHRCPNCCSARLYPQVFQPETSIKNMQITCTDCHQEFYAEKIEKDQLHSIKISQKAHDLLATELQTEM